MISRYVLLDLETVAAPDCEQWLPPIDADKRLTDPQKIADDLAKKKAAILDRAGLDGDLNQIVAFGLHPHSTERTVLLATDTGAERNGLELVWGYALEGVPFVGYGLSWFDLGVLVRRSQLLGVTVPERIYEQGKYRHPAIIELADRLTLNGMIEQKAGRGLGYHCQRLGIQVEDVHSGKDIAQLWRDGDLNGIEAHCLADLDRIRQLAQRLGVIPSPPPVTPDVPLTLETAF